MPPLSVRLFSLLIATVLLTPGCDVPATAPAPPVDFALRDVDGVEHHPFARADAQAVALLFVLADCPIANGSAPEVQRLNQEYGPRGVRFFLVQVDPDLTARDAVRHAQEYGYTCPVILDDQHALVRRAGVTMVPEAAVFARDGVRKYRGRIDDQYLALGKRQFQSTTHDLRAALDAVVAGRPVERPETPVVGCSIPPLSTKGTQP